MIGKRIAARAVLWMAACLCALSASAQGNTPCSGRKGGIAHCSGQEFVCNDGSISASKRSCPGYTGGSGVTGTARGLMAPLGRAAPDTAGCACRAGRYCTGPRGGVYCHSDSGAKSYLRR